MTGRFKRALVVCVLCVVVCNSVQAECVILLHGLNRSDSSMRKLARSLEGESFHVVNVDYPSRKFPIEELALRAIRPALEKCPGQLKVNFVTHSLGGILVRQYLNQNDIAMMHRVVMLGPPNHGSEVVDAFREWPGFHLINGDAGLQLGTGRHSVPKALGPASFELGIIAGTSSINFVFSYIVPGEDDGTVSVESTKLSGMSDHITLPVTHFFMMYDDQVIDQVVHYLKHGYFFEIR